MAEKIGSVQSSSDILNQKFLELRSMQMELGAALDRIERGQDRDTAAADPRYAQLYKGLEILGNADAHRAEELQMLYSIPVEG